MESFLTFGFQGRRFLFAYIRRDTKNFSVGNFLKQKERNGKNGKFIFPLYQRNGSLGSEGGGMKFVANDTARATFTFSTILRISSAVN